MKTTNILLAIPLLFLTAVGCTSDEQVGEPVTNEKGEYPVNFSGSMDMTLTKGDENPTNLENGVKATIYAYTNGATVTGESGAAAAITSGNYTADGSGNFSGTNYTMYLAKGSYDFYVVSCNSSGDATIPTFSNGTSGELSNGVDYLWGNATGQSIPNTGNFALNTENKNSVSLGLAHKAVCIEITVKTAANTGIELISWESTAANDNATIMPPANSNCKMSLSNGNIEPATSVVTAGTTASNMTTTGVTGTSGYSNEKTATASYYMLPLAASNGSSYELTVTFKVKVKIDGHTYTDENGESKTYTANLKAPESASYAFAGGSKYSYTATLKPNTISFTGATVTNWTAVTVDNDLEPTEPDASGGSN